MTSFSGRIEDVGDVGGTVYQELRVNASERLCLGHPSLKHHAVRESTEAFETFDVISV